MKFADRIKKLVQYPMGMDRETIRVGIDEKVVLRLNVFGYRVIVYKYVGRR